jgi:UDP-glucose 4-epimerase
MKVLITGGAGYIGSTIASALEDSKHTPILLDSLVTGNVAFTQNRIFYRGDVDDFALLERIFFEHPDISACIHCAALVIVPESVSNPHAYYRENVCKSLELFKNLEGLGCFRIVFSSSASIYAAVPGFMATELSPLSPSSPYARTKFMMEMILEDFCHASGLRGLALRYFNPIGADPKFRSGIHVRQPSHVLGKLVDVALGKLPEFEITGVDWETRDGSGIRDYIHVYDLALAHVLAVERFDSCMVMAGSKYGVVNLGTGHGVTVRELIASFEKVYKKSIPIRETTPRAGDVVGAFASAERALKWLDWRSEYSLEAGIASALEWAKRRKDILGYE